MVVDAWVSRNASFIYLFSNPKRVISLDNTQYFGEEPGAQKENDDAMLPTK